MNVSELNALHIVHVSSVLVLTGFTFFAFAGPAETRKRVLAITGVASLLVLLTGIRLWQGHLGFVSSGWIFVKLACWLGLSALTGVAYRRRDLASVLMLVAMTLVVTAVAMVYLRPF